MQKLILFIFCMAVVLLTSCDDKLSLQPENNIPAISLSQAANNELTLLEWTAVDHPGFSRYLVVRTDGEGVVPGDSLQLATLEIIHATEDPTEVSFVDKGPVISNLQYYQVLVEVDGRFIQSNVLKKNQITHSFEGILFFGKIVGGDNAVFYITRTSSINTPVLSRYNLATQTVEKGVEVPNVINSRVQLAYGDFGSGEPELVVTKTNAELVFYNPQTLAVNHKTSFSAVVEALTALPNGRLAILYEAGSKVTTYSRSDNNFGTSLSLSQGAISSPGFINKIPGKDELIIALQPTTLYKIAFDQNGVFRELMAEQNPSPNGIFTGLEIDPQGKYFMPGRFGEVFNVDDFEVAFRLPGDSATVGNRNWGFSSEGNSLFLVSNIFPATMFRYGRDDFALDFAQPLSPDFFIEKMIRFDNKNYFVFRTNSSPFTTLLAPLLD